MWHHRAAARGAMGGGVCGEGDALEQRDGLLRLLQRLVDAAELRGGKLAIAVDVKPRYFALAFEDFNPAGWRQIRQGVAGVGFEAEFGVGGGRRGHVELLWSSQGTEERFRVACQAMRESEVDVNVLQARKLLSATPPTAGVKPDGIESIFCPLCSCQKLQPNCNLRWQCAALSVAGRSAGARVGRACPARHINKVG